MAIQLKTRPVSVPLCLATKSTPKTPVGFTATGVFSCAKRSRFEHPHAKYQQGASHLSHEREEGGENGSSDSVSRPVVAAHSESAVHGSGKDCQSVSRRWVQPTSPIPLGSLPNVSLASHGWSGTDNNQQLRPGYGDPFYPGGRVIPHLRTPLSA